MNILYVGNRTLYNDAFCELISTRYRQVKLTRIPPPDLEDQEDPPGGQSGWQACFLDLSSTENDPLEQVRRVREMLPSGRLVALHDRPSDKLARALEDCGADHCLSFDSSTDDLDLVLREPDPE